MYVADRFVATSYMLKVRGCAYGAIKIGNEKKKNTTAASVDNVSGRTIKRELLTATLTAEVVYRTLCNSRMHGELCHDITKKLIAVFYTTHTIHHLRRPILSKKVHCITPKTPRHLLNNIRKLSSKVGSAASAKPTNSSY